MMTTEGIKNVLYRKATEVFPDIPVYKDVHPPVAIDDVKERIVINTLASTNEPWSKTVANINIFVPYDARKDYPAPNNQRLKELSSKAEESFFFVFFEVNEGAGVYEIDSIGTEHDPETWSYFINVRLMIQTTNFKL